MDKRDVVHGSRSIVLDLAALESQFLETGALILLRL